MDETPEYIEMCKAAHELHATWKIQSWDHFAILPEDRTEWREVGERVGDYEVYVMSGYTVDSGVYGPGMELICDWQEEEEFKKNIVWLPRVDQLVEMWGDGPAFRFITDFIFWVRASQGQEVNSFVAPTMERLYLMFLMHSKYQKKWSETERKWIQRGSGYRLRGDTKCENMRTNTT